MDRQRWDERYRAHEGSPGPPARVLTENAHLLPRGGRALDLACGLGANALFLAGRGLETHAWDYSEPALARLRRCARERHAEVITEVRDVVAHPPLPASFDVIVVSRFLERGLAAHLVQALRPRGLLFYQTYTREHVGGHGPGNPAFRLAENELLALFAPLLLRVYREEGRAGDTALGWRDEAMLVAEKR